MRIAYVSIDPGVAVFGTTGASVHIQSVLRVLVASGAEVHLITTRPGGDAPEALTGVHVHALPVARTRGDGDRERAVAAADAGVAAVLSGLVEDGAVDLVYERYSLWGHTATRWARAMHVPSVLEVNAPLVEEQAKHRVLVDRERAERVARDAFSTAGTVICVSDPVAAWVRSRGAVATRVFTVANGVDTLRVRPAARVPNGPFTIGFVGTLKPWHGVDILVAALARLRAQGHDHRLLLVGDGPQRDELTHLAGRLGVHEAVEMTGVVAPAHVPALLHRMHVAAAPYPALESFYFSPLKLYEYLAAGLPVIASAVGEIPAVLEHGRLGVLVLPGDVDALTAGIARLAADPRLRADLGVASRAAAVASHDWSRVVDRVLHHAGVSRVPA